MHADSSTVYIPAMGGTISALDIVSGALRWTWRWRGAEGRRRGTNSVRVHGDTLYAVGWEFVDELGGRSGGWIVALDARTGRQLWSRSFPAVTSGVGAEGQPAVHGDLVLMTLPGGIVMALDRYSGSTRWERASTAIRGSFSQVEVRGGVVYFDGGDEHVHAVDAMTGAEIWRSRYGLQSVFDLTVSEKHVLISAKIELVVFDRRTGRRVATWVDPTDRGGGSLFGIPLADEAGRVFVSGGQGLVCFRLR